jgi:hypothetical protein
VKFIAAELRAGGHHQDSALSRHQVQRFRLPASGGSNGAASSTPFMTRETIKWELWKVAYGVWNHIKNSGNFPEAENLTLEWVGTIPGKRESRRFEGDHMIIQQDLIEQRQHEDAVSFGGWAIDLHPSDGVFSEKPGCQQWHSKGVFQIPYRSDVQSQHQESFPRRPHHQRVAHRVRFDARDGDVRPQRSSGRHGGGVVPALQFTSARHHRAALHHRVATRIAQARAIHSRRFAGRQKQPRQQRLPRREQRIELERTQALR